MFRNIRLYRLESSFPWDAEKLEEALQQRGFRSCGPLEMTSRGWTSPLGDSHEELVLSLSGCLLMCLRQQDRLLPAAVIKEALEEQVTEIELAEKREVGQSEKKRLRINLINQLLPKAFTRSRYTLLYVDTESGWVVVDASSERQADDVIATLRETLGSLRVHPPKPEQMPSQLMTRWVAEQRPPQGFELEDACELRAHDDSGSVIRCSREDLSSQEIINLLRARKFVSRLALSWKDQLKLTLSEDLSLRQLRLADELLDELEADDDPATLLIATFAMLSQQLRQLLGELESLLGIAAMEKVQTGIEQLSTATTQPEQEDNVEQENNEDQEEN